MGSRMRGFSSLPKGLMCYVDGEFLVERLIRQLHQVGIDNITVVVGYKKSFMLQILDRVENVTVVDNPLYDKDKNILSMKLGLKDITDDDIVVFESDMIASDDLVGFVTGTDFIDHSVWYTNGIFKKGMYGGILRTDGDDHVTDIKIVDRYNTCYNGYHKLSGIMRINSSELDMFKKLLKVYSNNTLDQYYLNPWIENLDVLPCIRGDISHYVFSSFNTPEEYMDALRKNYNQGVVDKKIKLVSIDQLYPVEAVDKKHLHVVKQHIMNNGYWVKPLKVSISDGTVMDGHHSLAIAKDIGLDKVPVIDFSYDEVNIWSLHERYIFSKEQIIIDAHNGRLYPAKTVKHRFPQVKYSCNIRLDELKKNMEV